MDQFRGLTIVGMFAVHYASGFDWGVDLSAVFRHNNFYLSVGDLFFSWFQIAAGFSLRLALRRRLAAGGPVAAYGRTVRRCLLLILIALAPFLIGERPRSWDMLSGADALARVAARWRLVLEGSRHHDQEQVVLRSDQLSGLSQDLGSSANRSPSGASHLQSAGFRRSDDFRRSCV
jgi:hypothetical protein